jgi:hypothetical protein
MFIAIDDVAAPWRKDLARALRYARATTIVLDIVPRFEVGRNYSIQGFAPCMDPLVWRSTEKYRRIKGQI